MVKKCHFGRNNIIHDKKALPQYEKGPLYFLKQ